MVPTTYSPHSPAGGTLHLPSPAHLQHDAAKAIRSIRRSLSRSPSKTPNFHLVSPKQSSPKSPLSSSPLSPPPRTTSATVFATTPLRAPSPLAVPYPPSAKIHKSSIRRSLSARSSSRSTSRSRTTPNSPRKRALALSTDQGNSSTQQPSSRSQSSQEDLCSQSGSASEKIPCESVPAEEEAPTSSPAESVIAAPQALLNQTNEHLRKLTSSPRKRAEPIMGIDQEFCGSPAKRRSLHGASFDPSFQIFEQTSFSPSTSSPPSDDVEMSDAKPFNFSAGYSHVSAVPRRTSSLRRSTLQQRQNEKPSIVRSRPNADLAFEFAAPGAAASQTRSRLSLENFIQPIPRDSPFSSDGLQNASVHVVSQRNAGSSHQPHPLSHAISQSSSTNGSDGRSPFQPSSDAKPDFSKSLPAGAFRPVAASESRPDDLYNYTSSFETPQNEKSIRPFPGAFMSTGLISKRNRTLEDLRIGLQGKRSSMPDTPCKPHAGILQPLPTPFSSKIREKSNKQNFEFGTPSTPFSSKGTRFISGTFGKGMSIFNTNVPRRGSFIGADVDDIAVSPSRHLDSQTDSQSSEFDMPPTPTKRSLGRESGKLFKAASEKTRKFGEQTSGNSVALPPTSAFGPPSKSKSDISPLGKLNFLEQSTPHTPRESVIPPDPSGLSISGKSHHPRSNNGNDFSSSFGSAVPATPTGARGYFEYVSDRQNSMTPVHNSAAVDIDRSLTSRFNKVELIGAGEFSEVYRVTQAPRTTPDRSQFLNWSFSSARSSPRSFVADQVYAVKRSRKPYIGPKDRARKLEEVTILEALKGSDHVVQLVDQWEEKDHLYIQTEFCEEGSLDLFLAQVGIKARLDDFRTWKILLELAQGVQDIHDHGFIHLDLKPANVLITFEGVLKIADFGMATHWPARSGIDGEGDREYIGPEVLLGQFDKPADIFALGLIMVEIAANVELPDNGTSWQKLRAGDMSDVPSLTWSPESNLFRDASGNPITDTPYTSIDEIADRVDIADSMDSETHMDENDVKDDKSAANGALFRHGELTNAPSFMLVDSHEHALDHLVRWMISPSPTDRPLITQILEAPGLQWVEERKRAGATVFEGRWGPADEILRNDSEMMDF